MPISQPASVLASDATEDDALFAKLRAWRFERARADKVPSYVIMHDSVLHQLATLKPTSVAQLVKVKGIGYARAEKYGAPILAIIAESLSQPPAHPTPASPENPTPRPPDAGEIDSFLGHAHTRVLYGPWRAGWALDFHSRFDGDTQQRGVIGDLVFRYKYRGERALARDLAARWAQLLRAQRVCQSPMSSCQFLPRPSASLTRSVSSLRHWQPKCVSLPCSIPSSRPARRDLKRN